ncbi:hypothetical protein F441_20044 [Phytophthora nicotianae CJ01A1]|uniref:BZIP domain-containing protein n=6 Tax=Phytophthora nicotianae TaxID=4792 RepID=W2PJK1_PHYN3|nr:hypothetical protein PPTG_24265 [Phytophthora nicotianae INRA-310]ETI33137.1 hypothetical protein F443_20171 [Phytophthora nicotianae P1569]ETK73451.1 hypothetical protein L915_19619 [Phytophthora nicotianae]ETO61860.1 hypothetical protein F444_20181 [Phytophthora nicotianae P1976]ETP02950.1 hypothetical protein F441_20044 [Phytophthora nicotianae CJ01A1]ETP31116.1 hypothetical protein F442_19993 [Phytophthora nicotianae P10297]
MGRKRKYNTVADIEDAFRAPKGQESELDRKRRTRSRNAALNQLSKREEAALTAALESTNIKIGDDSVAVMEMVSEALVSVDAY